MLVYYAIIIGVSIILMFFAYAYGYSHGWRDAKKGVTNFFEEEHSSHADPTVPKDFQRH